MTFEQEWAEFVTYMRGRVVSDPRKLFLSMAAMDRHRNKRWALQLVNLTMEEVMARGKGATGKGAQEKVWSGSDFVTINLGGVEIGTVRAAYTDDAKVWEQLEHLVLSQYKVSFSFNPASNAVLCSMTCRAEDDPNEGKTMVSFAGGWYDALLVALYKHHVIAKGDWTAVSKEATYNYG